MPNDPPFDPCRQWLGIDAVELGNARRALGVGTAALDPIVVVRAADARLNLLRSLSPGPFEMARTALIKRVEEARDKLLAECAAAPAAPRSASGFAMPAPPAQWSAPPPPRPGVTPAPPPVPGQAAAHAGGVDPFAVAEQIRIRTTVYRKRTPWVGITLAVLGLAAAAGGLGYYYTLKVRPKGRRSPPVREESLAIGAGEPLPRRAPAAPAATAPEPERPPQSKPRRNRSEALQSAPVDPSPAPPTPVVPEPQAPRPEPAPDMADEPQDGVADKRLAEVLAALRRDAPAEETTPLLEQAFEGAQTAIGRRRIEAWEQLAAYYRGFLGYRDEALAAVSPGNEFQVKDQVIIVNTVNEQQLQIRVAGQNKTYPRNRIPAGIVLAIVTRFLENGKNAANDLYIGAYHLAKPASDPARARTHWMRAEAGGADASALMKLLDDPVFAQAADRE